MLFALCVALAGCKRAAPHERDDQVDEHEDEDDQRDLYWRARIVIVGGGSVTTANGAFDCTNDGARQHGVCGPKLVRFQELDPPLLRARDADGWRFDHWESTLRDRMPEGRMYMNAFGYTDTGQLETVTAVFVPR